MSHNAPRRAEVALDADLLREQARADQNAANQQKRWDRQGDENEAKGLPRTKRSVSGREPTYLTRDVEPQWIAEARRLGLEAPRAGRTALRVVAKRLSDAHTRVLTSMTGNAAAGVDDERLLRAYWEGEVERWHRRADRDIAMAATHREYAERAEGELARLMLAPGARWGK